MKIFFLATYLFSKLLPLLLLPLGASLLLIFISLKQRYWNLIKIAFIILWGFSLGLPSEIIWRWIEHPWNRLNTSQVSQADAIIVLSGGSLQKVPGNTKTFEWIDPDRFLAGIELFEAKKAPKILFTGVVNPYYKEIPPEGNIYIKKAIELGIPKNSISTTKKVFNTSDESKAIKEILNKEISQP